MEKGWRMQSDRGDGPVVLVSLTVVRCGAGISCGAWHRAHTAIVQGCGRPVLTGLLCQDKGPASPPRHPEGLPPSPSRATAPISCCLPARLPLQTVSSGVTGVVPRG